jgi:arylsulfatase A-like enzyme
MRSSLRLLPGLLGAGALLGALDGAIAGWHYQAAGYPGLLLATVRDHLHLGLLLALGFWLLFAGAELLARRWLPPRWALALAAALAAAPVIALAGYRLNRQLGIRPAEIFTPYALKANLLLLGLCGLLWLLLVVALRRWRREGAAPPGKGALVAVAAALVAVNAAPLAFLAPPGEAGERPPVLVILIDALRADHVGADGYDRPTTPALDALAADGVLFRQAISHSTFTKSSIASLFTGRYPYQHGVYWGSWRETPESITSDLLRPQETTLAERLRQRGYLTAAWVQNSHLRAFMGFAQGFVHYRDQQGPVTRINRLFRRWLDRAGRYPFFVYLHYIDLHDPYQPPPPYDTMFGPPADAYAGVDLAEWGAYLEAVRRGEVELSPEQLAAMQVLYDGQLRFIDDQIGLLLADLKRRGLYEKSLIVVTADHGDGFGEHGFIAHSTVPYEELVRVPLIVKLPGERFAGRKVEAPVGLVDVLPTVLQVAGAPPPGDEVAGCSLLPLIEQGEAGWDPVCSEAVIEIAEEGAYPIVAVRTARYKYIHHEKRPDELYDLTADPGEHHNLAPATEGEPLRLAERAQEVVKQRRLAEERIELDEKTIRELKALGYID